MDSKQSPMLVPSDFNLEVMDKYNNTYLITSNGSEMFISSILHIESSLFSELLIQSFIADKYSNIDAVHHYEVSQTSGDTSIKIDIGTDTTGYSEADLTTVTNREFEEERQDKLRQIRLLDRAYIEQFVEEFETLMGASVL